MDVDVDVDVDGADTDIEGKDTMLEQASEATGLGKYLVMLCGVHY